MPHRTPRCGMKSTVGTGERLRSADAYALTCQRPEDFALEPVPGSAVEPPEVDAVSVAAWFIEMRRPGVDQCVSDAYKVLDPVFGRREVSRKFVDCLSSLGVRVVLDWEFDEDGLRSRHERTPGKVWAGAESLMNDRA